MKNNEYRAEEAYKEACILFDKENYNEALYYFNIVSSLGFSKSPALKTYISICRRKLNIRPTNRGLLELNEYNDINSEFLGPGIAFLSVIVCLNKLYQEPGNADIFFAMLAFILSPIKYSILFKNVYLKSLFFALMIVIFIIYIMILNKF